MQHLRVLFMATRDWYNPATTGGDNTMWENARYLASRGHKVTFLAAAFQGAALDASIDGHHVVRLGGIHSLWSRTLVYYLANRGRYDVVVAEGFGGSRIPRLAPLYVKEPLVTEWHQVHRDLFEAQYPRVLRGPLNLLECVAVWVNRNTFVRAGTEEWRDAFVQVGFKPDKVFVLPVSIRDDWLTETKPNPVTEPNILWLGKIRRYKRPDHVIKAMPAVLKRVPGAHLTIAGRHDDVPYERQLQSLVDGQGLHEHVAFRFDLSEDEKRDLIQRSRVLVIPSVVEGFGIVALEANACGVPVVASSGVPQGAVSDGKNGLRYPSGDIGALADCICTVLRDDSLYGRLSEGGLNFVRQFAWSKVGAQFEHVVEDVVAMRRSKRSLKPDDSAAKIS
jgi:glycosyltransferase involved in cell wall biosynthesis